MRTLHSTCHKDDDRVLPFSSSCKKPLMAATLPEEKVRRLKSCLGSDSPPSGWQREWWECQGSLYKSWLASPQNMALHRLMWIQHGFTNTPIWDVWTDHSVKMH